MVRGGLHFICNSICHGQNESQQILKLSICGNADRYICLTEMIYWNYLVILYCFRNLNVIIHDILISL